MRILAIDLGTSTGWAFIEDNDASRIRSGSYSFSLKPGETDGVRFLRFRARLLELIDLTKPDVIAYELVRFHRGGPATRVYHGFEATLKMVAEEAGVDLIAYHVGTIKKFATGAGNASKADVIIAARAEWPFWEPGNPKKPDDEADARWIAYLAADDIEAASGAGES